ncbi:MAG: hypothetical protein ACRD9R_21540, partial [Pyrinomonadaceae bacterium]
MKFSLFVSALVLSALGCLLFPHAAAVSGMAATTTPPPQDRKDEPLAVQVTPWGPTQDQLDLAAGQLSQRASVRRLLRANRHRLISFNLIDPDDKTGRARTPPTRFVGTFYDYTNNRTILAEGSFDHPEKVAVTVSDGQPLPSQDEFEAAVNILRGDQRFSVALNDGRVQAYQPMPPLVYTERSPKGRIERTLTVGLILRDGAEMKLGRPNEVVAVNLARRTVVRYESGAPPRAKAAPTSCGPPSAGQPTTSRGAAGQYILTINQGGQELWNMLVVRPSASSGTDGSGIEVRDVK